MDSPSEAVWATSTTRLKLCNLKHLKINKRISLIIAIFGKIFKMRFGEENEIVFMKSVKTILGVLMIMVLASCSGEMAGLGLPGFGMNGSHTPPVGFYDNLSNEYKNLSAFQETYMSAPVDAEHFAAKARQAQRGQNVVPDRPEERDIPDFAAEELATARAMLLDALEHLAIKDNEALLAMAQTRYDCWLAFQEDFPKEDAWISCKQDFYDALALLNLPSEDSAISTIYFDTGSIAINKEARKTLGKMAQRFVDRPYWHITLKGFTDSKGDKRQNQTLSMRRAIAVKNTLGQYGLNLANIAISAEGEIVDTGEGEDDSHSRKVEVSAWPSYVAHEDDRQKILAGWSHRINF